MRQSLAALFLFASALSAAEPDLKPADTYAVIAGVLQWPGNRLTGFPTKHRKDEELHDALKKRGVPPENMKLLLDEEATYSGIQRAIKSVAAKAPAGATLIVYYCGHGFPAGPGRELCLANYDVIPQRPDRTGLLASELAAMVKADFKGKRVLFLADCCFSGGLGAAADTLHKAGFDAAAVTSSSDHVISTVNWTFSQTVIDALNGDAFADADGDGLISLGELSAEVKAAMNALERQTSGNALHGWNADFKLSVAKPKAKKSELKFQPGDYVVVRGANRAGRVLGGADGKFAVQFYDYTEKVKLDVPEDKLSPIPDGWADRKARVAGNEKAEIEVEWNGQWWPATILKKDGDRTFIHYVGWGDNFDEWVTKDRIRPLKK